MFGSAYGGARQKSLAAPKEAVINCPCTLQELYVGCTKHLEYEREVLGIDQRSTRRGAEARDVVIKPGYSQSSVLRFPKMGNEAAFYPACIVWHD